MLPDEASEPKPRIKRRQGYRYIPGKWLIGVPARDLTVAEFDALPKHVQSALLDQGVYEEKKRS
jgi:hypothetical protein